MKVLVCGDRNWINKDLIKSELQKLEGLTELIHGGCRGADLLAAEVGRELVIYIKCFPAPWNSHGLAAGPIRNQQMIDEGEPDLVLALQ